MAGEDLNHHHRTLLGYIPIGLSGKFDSEVAHGFQSFLLAEGSLALSGMRTYAGSAVPSELQVTGYNTSGVPLSGPDRAMVELYEYSMQRRGSGLELRLSARSRRYVVAEQAVDAAHMREAGLHAQTIQRQIQRLRTEINGHSIDLRILPSSARAPKHDEAFTVLTDDEGVSRAFVERDGLMCPAPEGSEREYQDAWETLHGSALGMSASVTFLVEQATAAEQL